MSNAAIAELISEESNLRAPPSALPYLLEKLAQQEIEYDDLAETIERFPSIVARLISVANSAWSSPRSPITSLRRACTHLGLALTRSIAISLAVSAPFSLNRCLNFDLARF